MASQHTCTCVLSLVVPDLPNLQSAVACDPCLVGGLPCLLLAAPRGVTSSSQEVRGKAMGVYVQCVPDQSKCSDWKLQAHVTLILVNHKNPAKNYSKDFNHCFSSQQHDWGFSSFIKWNTLVDPSRGYLKEDGSITLQAHVTAQPTIEDFPSGERKSAEVPFLACPGCMEDFQSMGIKQPMSLRCGHTFCQECLRKRLSGSGGVGLLLRCQLCSLEHRAAKEEELWFSNLSLMQMIGKCNLVPKSRFFCSLHQHDKSFYCFDDQTLICIYCAYHGDHKGHDCLYIEEARKKMEDSLAVLKLQASGRMSELERNVMLLESEKSCVRDQQQVAQQAIETFFAGVEAALQQQKAHLLEQLTANTSDVVSTITEQLREQESKSDEFSSTLSEFATWKKLPARDALGSVATLQSKLRCISTFATTVPITPTGLKFSFELPCSDVLTSIGSLGNICIRQSPASTSSQPRVGEESGDGGSDAKPSVQRDDAVNKDSSPAVDSFKPPLKRPRK